MPTPTTFTELLERLDETFPDQLPQVYRNEAFQDTALRLHRLTGQREVVDFIRTIFNPQAGLTAEPLEE
jgi:hypothetical protein